MIEIRKIKLEDASKMLDCYKTCLSETKYLSMTSDELTISINDERSFINRIPKDELLLVALDDDIIVGNIYLRHEGFETRRRHNYNIGIMVRKAYWNQGVASKLLTEVINYANENQIFDIYLSVNSDNVSAIHLYEKFGFRLEGTRVNYIKYEDNTFVDLLDYKLDLRKSSKEDLYQEAISILPSLLEGNHYLSNLANFATFMWDYMKDINWLGFYLNLDGKLILGPYKGKVACTTINYDKGVCGACYTNDKVMLVKDVHVFPGHIACDSASNSEIVLPIHKNGKIFGLLDIDSPYIARFDETDQKYLEEIVKIIEKELAK